VIDWSHEKKNTIDSFWDWQLLYNDIQCIYNMEDIHERSW
jgi:hypothetical protein